MTMNKIHDIFITPYEEEPKKPEPKYTDEDLAKVKKEAEDKIKTLTSELSALSQKVTLTAEQRREIEAKLEEANTKNLTELERANRTATRLQKELEETKKGLSTEADTWKTRFVTKAITSSLAEAANKHGAYNGSQIIELLSSKSSVVEVKDAEGNPTGELTVVTKVTSNGKTIEMPADEAVKVLSEDDGYANLFKRSGAGGLGTSTSGGRKNKSELYKNPAAYRAARAKNEI